jgi:hypothetical protein
MHSLWLLLPAGACAKRVDSRAYATGGIGGQEQGPRLLEAPAPFARLIPRLYWGMYSTVGLFSAALATVHGVSGSPARSCPLSAVNRKHGPSCSPPGLSGMMWGLVDLRQNGGSGATSTKAVEVGVGLRYRGVVDLRDREIPSWSPWWQRMFGGG